jgi:hypothetical protein
MSRLSESAPDSVNVEKGGPYTCLSNGKLKRNIGECAGSGVLSHTPVERFGVELEFEQPSRIAERLRTGLQISCMRMIWFRLARVEASKVTMRTPTPPGHSGKAA